MKKIAFYPREGLPRILWLTNLLFALVLCLALWTGYQQQFHHAGEKAENMALALERSLSGTLDRIDLVLVSVGNELESEITQGKIDPQKINGTIAHLIHDVPWVNSVRYSDATGRVADDSGGPAGNPGITIQGQDYRRWLRDRGDGAMVDVKPVIERTGKKWIIVFSRPYRSPDRKFAGIVLAGVDLSHFSDMFGALKLGERAKIAFLDRDFAQMAVHPVPRAPYEPGRRIAHEGIIQLLQASVQRGMAPPTEVLTTKADNLQHIYAFRKLEARPYWITVGLSVKDELAPWRKQVGLALIVMLVFATLTGAAGWQLQRGWRRQKEILALMKSTLEATDNGILVVSEFGRTLHSNRRFIRMWRIPQELDASGDEKAMLDHVLGQLIDPQNFLRKVETLYANPLAEAFDILEFKDGRVFERSSLPMLMDGKPAGRVWSFRDVSERKRIDELSNFIAQRGWAATGKDFLPALAERLSRTLHVDHAFIAKLSEKPGMAETVGLYAHGALMPDFSYPLAGSPSEKIIGKEICVYRQGVRQSFPEDRLLDELQVESYLGVPLWDSSGHPIGLIAALDRRPLENTGQSLSLIWLVAAAAAAEIERLREEKLLRYERDRAQSYLDTVDAMIVVLDKEGRISLINRKGCRLLGWREDELIGQSWFELCLRQPEGKERTCPHFIKMDNGERGSAEYFENTVITRSGKTREIAWHRVLLYDDQERVTGTLSAGEDITERKQRDLELEDYRHRLEDLVDARTVELTKAKAAAERANRAKSVFLANMNHELRTPMNAILGFSQLLERDPALGGESRKKLAAINRAGRHLLALINDVLEISRIEAGHAAIQREPFNLTELLDSVEEMIRIRTEEKALAFHVECAADIPPFVEGDGHHLKQVLINLLGNAVKFADRGRVALRVRRQGGDIRFEVSDTGPGIAADEQERIFQPFYQTETGIVKGEGTGLGLAISREYTERMGGRLEVTSIPEKGSIFVLTLPLPQSDAPITAKVSDLVVGLEDGQEGLRVLVADDKPSNRELVRQLLEAVGFEVRGAENGLQAVEVFQNWHPCFIWMDMRMPTMDGYDATRRIRSLPGGGQVKIVALTANVFEENRQAILAAGCDDMESKPLDAQRLYAVMEKLLGVRFRHAAASAPEEQPSLGVNDFALLPSECILELQSAAVRLDLQAVRAIAARIGGMHPQPGDGLAKLVEEFRFDRIIELCRQALRDKPHPDRQDS